MTCLPKKKRGFIITRFRIAILIAIICFSQPAFSSAVNSDNKEHILRLEGYLNSIQTFVASFIQAAPDGSLSEGTFFMKRPGKVRWQYDPPVPIIIVGQGGAITYYDYELEQISYVDVDSDIVNFLMRENISFFQENIEISDFSRKDGLLKVTLGQVGQPEEGYLTMVFTESPIELTQMALTTNESEPTIITFKNQRHGVKLDKKLFYIPKPRRKKRR